MGRKYTSSLNHQSPTTRFHGPPVGALLQVDTASTETIPILIPPPGPGIGFSSAYAPSPSSSLAVLPDVGLGRSGMSKSISSSDSTRSETPRIHNLNIYGPPPVLGVRQAVKRPKMALETVAKRSHPILSLRSQLYRLCVTKVSPLLYHFNSCSNIASANSTHPLIVGGARKGPGLSEGNGRIQSGISLLGITISEYQASFDLQCCPNP